MTASQVEIRTVERAILCADGKSIHFGSEFFKDQEAAELLRIADANGSNAILGSCSPHRYATRERIVTGWTEANT